MTVVLRDRFGITLDAVRRVAWQGEDVRLRQDTLEHIGACRRSFMQLIESDSDITVYGVTTGMGERASVKLGPDEQKAQAARPPLAGASFGRPLPERVVRAIVLARLANFLDGHAAVRPELAQAVAAMLDGRTLPEVPVQGNGSAGEILALGHLFAELAARVGTEEKESLSLINGSPCAAALAADSALAGRSRLRLAHTVFALSAEAIGAPLEAYAPELEELWGDEHETAALRALRALLAGGSDERRPYQAPVSYRILPRVLAEANRALAGVEQVADISLRSVSDNPVYIVPDAEHPLGRVWSTGGYHNGMAYPALDRLASAWANLCQLAERQVERLANDGFLVTPGTSGFAHILLMPMVGYAEEARAAAQATILPRGGYPQNDVTAPSFIAWEREEQAAGALEACLAVLAACASQALHASGRDAPPALRGFLAEVRELFPPVDEPRTLGPDAGRLAAAFHERVYAPGDTRPLEAVT
jgi:histidine ammonia-lyase